MRVEILPLNLVETYGQSANCYIISLPGTYEIDTYKGVVKNLSSATKMQGKSAGVVWNTNANNSITASLSADKTKVIVNVCGKSIEDYVEVVERLGEEPAVSMLEINVSCPNVHGGGMSFGTDPKAAAEVTEAVRKVTKKPIFIKLTPNVTDIVSIAKACEAAGADGISMINTMLGMRINLRTKKPIIANKMGGFSGSAIMPVALRMVYQVYDAVKIPIIGMGGLSSAEDVIEMMLAGATAVQVGAANLIDPFACKDIIEQLPSVMEKYNINSLEEIIGGAHHE